MRHACFLLLAAVTLCGCKPKSAPEESGRLGGERCAHIADLSDVMHCELAPYTSGTLTDELAFRKALEQLRDLAPSDPAFYSTDKPWPAIVQNMLDRRDYKRGCAECHHRYDKIYKQRFGGTQIPWTDVHAPPAAAAK